MDDIRREINRRYQRQLYADNRVEMQAAARIRHKRYYQAHPERAKVRYQIRKYNLTSEQYQIMIQKQNTKCLICDENMLRPHVDHDHKTGIVRGLLCRNCNLALGHVKDDPRICLSMAHYINSWKQEIAA